MKFFKQNVVFTILLYLCFSCNSSESTKSKLDISQLKKASAEDTDKLVAQFIEAKEGSTIEIPAGFYDLTTQLVLDSINNVTIKGAGKYATVLSFKNLSTGGEGMKIAGNHILLQDFTVLDAPGDDIKTQKCDGIVFRNLNASWTNSDLAKSGTYGIYPVQCKNVVVDNCEVSHSRDAGIYVGQSENIVVKNCYVFENVAGIEIENSDNAEVFNNQAINNTSGILVFNLPGLPKASGSNTKVYKNLIKANNHVNFAKESGVEENGNPISMIPPGSGMIVMAGNNVEVFENQIYNHKTTGMAILSYQITELKVPVHAGWSPFSTNIYFHDNDFKRNMDIPDMTKKFGQLITAKCHKPQDIIYDGIVDDTKPNNNGNPMNICIQEKSADLRFTKFEIPASGNVMDIVVNNDISKFKTCKVAVTTNISFDKQ